jgi:hypothetical protein
VPVADAPSPSWPCFSFSFRFFFAATPPHDTARHRVSPTALKRSPPKGPKRHDTTRSGTEQQRGDCETATHRKHLASDQAINSRTCVEGRGDGCEREELQTSESVMVMVSAATVLLLFG